MKCPSRGSHAENETYLAEQDCGWSDKTKSRKRAMRRTQDRKRLHGATGRKKKKKSKGKGAGEMKS